jgi:DNA modification methylase
MHTKSPEKSLRKDLTHSEPAKKYHLAEIAKLIPYARNARLHSDKQVSQIAASLVKFGMVEPIIVDKKNNILAGHGRVLAAETLGWKTIDAIEVGRMTAKDKRAYIIASNRLAELASWDNELLGLELKGLLDEKFDVSLVGFSSKDLNGILPQDIALGNTDEEAIPEYAPKVAKLNDLWALGKHRLFVGDCTNPDNVAALLGDIKPHLMVTDPPYGVEYDANWRNEAASLGKCERATGKVSNDDKTDWSAAWVLFEGDVAYIWHAGNKAHIVAESIEQSGFDIRAQIIWAKNNIVISRGHYHPKHEPCWYAVKKTKTGHWSGDRKQSTIWEIDKPMKSETGHSTQKPVECMRRPMQNNSSEGQAVYDPFLGSGTSIIAAETIGRHCYGLELVPKYADIIIKRWQDFTGLKANKVKKRDS